MEWPVFRFSTTMAKLFLLRRNESGRTISSNQALQPTAQTALFFACPA
jgi:hypothetical protein